MNINEMIVEPSIERLQLLKGAIQTFADRFEELSKLMDEDLKNLETIQRAFLKKNKRKEPDGFVCIKIEHGDDEHEHCHCHGQKRRGRRHEH